MKKKYLTYAGIVSALVLAGMFAGIFLSGIPFPFLPPATTMDPITNANIDGNNIMVLAGTTTLPEDSDLTLRVTASPRSAVQGTTTGITNVKGFARIISEAGGTRWKGTVNISSLQPADYTIILAANTYTKNYTLVKTDTLATQQFTLGDADAGPGSIRKKTRAVKPFIRINPTDQKPVTGNPGISGITGFAPGTPLAWSIRPVTSGTGNDTPEYSGTVVVIPGTGGINRWNVVPGAGAAKPARYRFTIAGNPAGNTPPAGTITAISEFAVPPLPATLQNTTGSGHISPGFITIDSLPDMGADGTYIITGTTSLPPDEELLVQVRPAAFITGIDFSVDKNNGQIARGTDVAGTIHVVNGNSGKNLWSFDLETYLMIPGMYEVNVSNDTYSYGSIPVPGDLYDSRIVPIGG